MGGTNSEVVLRSAIVVLKDLVRAAGSVEWARRPLLLGGIGVLFLLHLFMPSYGPSDSYRRPQDDIVVG